ncbi:MAG: hypothetical protein JHC87_02005 [Thermoleophilaceae bacterium]|nr:hypothetical protein [Thermoleophilaceae bacterium]
MSHGIDFAAEGLLEGTSDERSVVARERLLEHLLGQGVPLAELKNAVLEGRLLLLPIEQAMGGDLKYTVEEAAQKCGLDVELMLELRRSLGLAEPPRDQPLLSDLDIGVYMGVKHFLDMGISIKSVREITRVLGAGMSQVAATVERVMINDFLVPEDDEYEIAMRFERVAQSIAPEFGFVLLHIHNLHLREQTRMDVLNLGTMELLSDAREMAVCFADLVGFTALGAQVPPDELSEIATRLTELTVAIVQPPVRLIKTIGDAVMLASTETVPLLNTALDLLDAVIAEGEGFPQIRLGVAVGEVIVRSGDIYGPPVNLASRMCDVAKPSSVLAEKHVQELYPDDYEWSNAGHRRFKNMPEPIEGWRLRRKGTGKRAEKSRASEARSDGRRSSSRRS